MNLAFFENCIGGGFKMSSFMYIDPATTSYLIQIIVGVAIAVGTGIGIFRSKIKKAFKRKKKEEVVEAVTKRDTEGKDCVTAEDLLADDASGEEE